MDNGNDDQNTQKMAMSANNSSSRRPVYAGRAAVRDPLAATSDKPKTELAHSVSEQGRLAVRVFDLITELDGRLNPVLRQLPPAENDDAARHYETSVAGKIGENNQTLQASVTFLASILDRLEV